MYIVECWKDNELWSTHSRDTRAQVERFIEQKALDGYTCVIYKRLENGLE